MKHFPPLELSAWAQVRRVVRHWFSHSGQIKRLLTDAERERIAQRIEASERGHSGEIAVAFETALSWRYLRRRARARERAWEVFGRMQVWDTPHNNGVLIYILWADKRIEIVADRALAEVVAQTQWETWVHTLYQYAQKDRWCDGILAVIDGVDKVLAQHFSSDAVYDNRADNAPLML